MREESAAVLEDLIVRYPKLAACEGAIVAAFDLLADMFRNGGKLLLVGNGGSAADCAHIAGELMKGFLLERRLDANTCEGIASACRAFGCESDELTASIQNGLPAISLVENTALLSAFSNDCDARYVFAQQVQVLGCPGDTLLAISTSGTSENVIAACVVARARGLKVIGLTGGTGGKLAAAADVCITAPESVTFVIQELHLPIYHALCAALEAEFFTV